MALPEPQPRTLGVIKGVNFVEHIQVGALSLKHVEPDSVTTVEFLPPTAPLGVRVTFAAASAKRGTHFVPWANIRNVLTE